MKLKKLTWLPLMTIATIAFAGCQETETTGTADPISELPPATMDDHDDHAHPSEGPHHGELQLR